MPAPTPKFWSTFWNSIVTPSAYHDFSKRSWGRAAWYLVRVLVLANIVMAIKFLFAAAFFLPMVGMYTSDAIQEIPPQYPAGLVVTVQSGSLSMNRPGPVRFALPTVLTELMSEEGVDGEFGKYWSSMPKYLVTIDPRKTAEDYRTSESIVLLTQKSMVFPDNDAGTRMISYDENIVVTQAKVMDMSAKIKKGYPMVAGIVSVVAVGLAFFLPFFLAPFQLIVWMVLALIIALVALVASALLKRNWKYEELYKASLYGATPVLLLQMILGFFISLPGVSWILAALWMIIVVAVAKKTATPKKKAAPKK